MSLKDDIRTAIEDSRGEWLHQALSIAAVHVDILVDKVWAVLEDRIGSVQEKLMNDLTYARTQRDQAVARVNALTEVVAQQSAELEALRGQVAAQQ